MREQAGSNPSASERDTFSRFLDGDDAAFVELFDRYDRRLRLYCTKMVRNVGIAEDLTQELWERVIRMRSTRQEILEPARYLLTMARNHCLKHLGREHHHTSLHDLNEEDHPRATAHEPSHLEELVRIAIDELPFEQREIIVLHNYCGYSYEDIAGLRDETLGSVKMRALRARGRVGRIISAFLALGKEGERAPSSNGDYLSNEINLKDP